MKSLLEVACPTTDALLSEDVEFFSVGYSWNDATGKRMSHHTVVAASNANAALEKLRRQQPHLTHVWLRK